MKHMNKTLLDKALNFGFQNIVLALILSVCGGVILLDYSGFEISEMVLSMANGAIFGSIFASIFTAISNNNWRKNNEE